MIICPNQKFVFVHIPKCAGTSIRSQIVKCDPDQISLGNVSRHPVLGKIDYGHIPLSQLREHFPDEYAALQTFPSYAIVRDPLARFGSALRQVMWQYEKRPMTLIPKDEVREKTVQMLDDIAANIDKPTRQHIFFSRQDSFIFDGETQVVKHLIPLPLVPDFIGHLARTTGVVMEAGARANQNVDLRVKGLGKVAYGLNDVLRNRLPGDLHAKFKGVALKILAKKGGNAAEASGVLDMPEVRDFVATHYVRDTQIYNDLMMRQESLKAALLADDLKALRA